MNEKELLVVTGATGGLGKCIANFLAREALQNDRYHVVLCCRNEHKGAALCRELETSGLPAARCTLLRADLSSNAGVDNLVEQVKALSCPIHWWINNAAAMFPDYGLNTDGLELHMAMNFMAPARLSELIAEQMTVNGSLVNILSCSRNFFPLKANFLTSTPSGYFRLRDYSRSKLALSIFTADMAARYPQLHINGVDPGVMNTGMLAMGMWFDPLTDLLFRPFTRKPIQSMPAVMAACRNPDKVSGQIFTNTRHFPIERKIAQHPLREAVRKAVLQSL